MKVMCDRFLRHSNVNMFISSAQTDDVKMGSVVIS